jgi:hypothetical protein
MNKEQPMSKPGKTKVFPLVMTDLEERKQKGIETYKLELETNNGRDPLWDAYEETLDKALYLRQAIEERREMFSEEAIQAVAEKRAEKDETGITPISRANPMMFNMPGAVMYALVVKDFLKAQGVIV